MRLLVPLFLFFAFGRSASALSPMPTARYGLGAIVVDGKLYAIGGDINARPTSVVERYDPATDSWERLERMPTPRGYFALAAVGRKIYVIGGEQQEAFGLPRVSAVEVLDTATGRWSVGPTLPEPRAFGYAAAIGRFIYVLGGEKITAGGSVDTVDVLDTGTGKWRRGPRMPGTRAVFAGAVLGGQVWLSGGVTATSKRALHLRTVERFDPRTGRWTPGPALPWSGASGSAAAGGRLYVFGGGDDGRSDIDSMALFDGAGWQAAPRMPTGRSSFGAASDGRRIYVVGGSPGRNINLNTLEIYDPRTRAWQTSASGYVSAHFPGRPELAQSQRTDGWRALPPLPTARMNPAVAAAGDALFVIGGENSGGFLSAVDIYHPAQDRWSHGPSMPTARTGAFGCAIGRTVFVAGGNDASPDREGGNALRVLEALDTRSMRWSERRPMPTGRRVPGVACLGGNLYVAGGAYGPPERTVFSGAFERYDPASDSWSSLAPLPNPRAYLTLTAQGGRIYAVGGANDSGALSEVDVYDPSTGRWSPGSYLASPVQFQAGATVRETAHLVGGWNGAAHVDSHLALESSGWVTLDQAPAHFIGAQAAGLGDCLYVFGGRADAHLADVSARAFQWCGTAGQPAVATEPPPAPAPTVEDELEPPPPAARPRPNDYALVIGLDDYRSVMASEFGKSDADAFARYAVTKLGVPADNVITLTGQRAARTDFVKYVEEWLPRNVEAKSRVYVYYSGHGAPDPEKGDSFLLPWDGDPMFLQSTGYPLARLYEKLSALPAAHVVVFLDSCFSGAGGRSVIAKNLRPLVHMKATPVPGRGKLTVLTASGASQVAGGYEAKRHGLFTYYLLKGLGGEAAGGKHLDVSGLYEFVRANVRREAHRENREQDPQLQTSEPGLRLY